MSDVEFLEPDEPDGPGESPAATAPASGRRVPVAVLGLVLAAAGVVLAVLAAFATAYRVRVTGLESSEGGGGYRLDGWGRYGAESDSVGQHGVRVGIVLCVAAGLVVVGVVLWAVSLRRTRAWRLVGSGVVLVAAGAVLAAAAFDLLGALAASDSFRAALRATDFQRPDGTSPRPTVHLELGGLLWLAVASAALLAVAAVAVAFARPLARPHAAPPAAEAAGPVSWPPPVHRDDELLG